MQVLLASCQVPLTPPTCADFKTLKRSSARRRRRSDNTFQESFVVLVVQAPRRRGGIFFVDDNVRCATAAASVCMHMHHPCTHCTEPPPSSSLSLRDSPRVRRAGATRSRRNVRRQDFRIQFALVLLHPSMFEAAICTAPPFYVI